MSLYKIELYLNIYTKHALHYTSINSFSLEYDPNPPLEADGKDVIINIKM